MTQQQLDPMTEAMQLIREGRLTEATTRIQRALAGGSLPARMPRASARYRPPASTWRGRNTPQARAALPGTFLSASLSTSAGTRAYKLYVPSGYTGQYRVPLVVMLHGCRQNPDDFAEGTRMNALAEKETFLVVYPHQNIGANSGQCWNWFQPAHQMRDAGEPAIIAGITEHIQDTYASDPTRTYIAGMSAGGAMAVVLAATYPDLYAAVGVHSGLAYGVARDVASAFHAMHSGATSALSPIPRPIPLIIFHGDNDTTVQPVNADSLRNQWLHSLREEMGCTILPVPEIEKGNSEEEQPYTRAIYYDTCGRIRLEQWALHTLGHAWSGGNAVGSYTAPHGVNASAEMLRFFGQQRLVSSHTIRALAVR